MVKAIVDISKRANKIINIVKAQFELNDKSLAINRIVESYGKMFVEPELNPAYIRKIQMIQKQRTIPVEDFARKYKLR